MFPAIAAKARRFDIMRTANDSTRISEAVAEPLFIIGLPPSHAPLFVAMLGQHPEMYSLPQTHLFLAETLHGWCSKSPGNMADGLLRVIAQVFFGKQTESSVQLARAWLQRRLSFTTGYVFELIVEKVHPLIVVENSASIVFQLKSMKRAQSMFPRARFIHLMQHPFAYRRSVASAVRNFDGHRAEIPRWLRRVACSPDNGCSRHAEELAGPDPQRAWYALTRNICDFLAAVPRNRRFAIRSEDLVLSPNDTLRTVARWMGLRTDDEAIEGMKHPERSPYACFGPAGARFGNNPNFLNNPGFNPVPMKCEIFTEPSGWRRGAGRMLPEVIRLAQRIGYE